MSSYNCCPIVGNKIALSPFGQHLVDGGWLDAEQMSLAEQVQKLKSYTKYKHYGQSTHDYDKAPLITIVEDILRKELPHEEQERYRRVKRFSFKVLYQREVVDISTLTPKDKDKIVQLIDELIPEAVCRRFQLFPLKLEEYQESDDLWIGSLKVAMVNLDDLSAEDELNRILRPKNIRFEPLAIMPDDYVRIISQYLDGKAAQEKQGQMISKMDVSADLGDPDSMELEDNTDPELSLESVLADPEAAPVINLVNKILFRALDEEVSAIHIEPQKQGLRVRFCKNEQMQIAFDDLPNKIIPAVTTRIKIIASLDITERYVPQTGRIRRMFNGKRVDFEVISLPSRFGETIVLKIHQEPEVDYCLSCITEKTEHLQAIRKLLIRSYGLLLVFGDSDFSRRHTLYTLVQECNHPNTHIITIEDPIEESLPGLIQVQARTRGLGFSNMFQASLQQDPHIIMLSELESISLTQDVLKAAKSDRLILAAMTVHKAVDAISQMLEMGIAPYLINRSLIGVIGQASVRKLCDQCRVPTTPDADLLAQLNVQLEPNESPTFYQAGYLEPDELEQAKNRGWLCPNCRGTGYSGHVTLCEILPVTSQLKQAIRQQSSDSVLQQVVESSSVVTFRQGVIELAKQGVTTLEEVERICGEAD
ncbi:MAG: GspE/PulE family protein [Leptolyngbyaceae cyanobacterium]